MLNLFINVENLDVKFIVWGFFCEYILHRFCVSAVEFYWVTMFVKSDGALWSNIHETLSTSLLKPRNRMNNFPERNEYKQTWVFLSQGSDGMFKVGSYITRELNIINKLFINLFSCEFLDEVMANLVRNKWRKAFAGQFISLSIIFRYQDRYFGTSCI